MRCIKSTFEYILNFIIVHLFIGVIWLNNTYGHTTGEEKVFHLLVPLNGVNSDYYKSYIFTAIIPTVIYCSDSMINDFVDWLKAQDFYEDTVIIMVGDHISMDTDFFKNIPKNYERTTYNVFINTDYQKENIKTKERLFTQLDMLPTTISAIGGKIDGDRLGLGTNLFSNEKTLIEKYNYEKVKNELGKKSDFYNSFMGVK